MVIRNFNDTWLQVSAARHSAENPQQQSLAHFTPSRQANFREDPPTVAKQRWHGASTPPPDDDDGQIPPLSAKKEAKPVVVTTHTARELQRRGAASSTHGTSHTSLHPKQKKAAPPEAQGF